MVMSTPAKRHRFQEFVGPLGRGIQWTAKARCGGGLRYQVKCRVTETCKWRTDKNGLSNGAALDFWAAHLDEHGETCPWSTHPSRGRSGAYAGVKEWEQVVDKLLGGTT